MNNFMKRMMLLSVMGCMMALVLGGCSTAPKTEGKRQTLLVVSEAAVQQFKVSDPQLNLFFNSAKAFAIFPTVGKGGVGIGGAYGHGVVYEGGVVTGYCDLKQASIGFQLGGQAYSEIIFFETNAALANFKSGTYAFSAQASAVAVTAGAAANADYEGGVAVFTEAKGGLMYEASVGGQKFSYQAK